MQHAGRPSKGATVGGGWVDAGQCNEQPPEKAAAGVQALAYSMQVDINM